jgi:hypothetical protein
MNVRRFVARHDLEQLYPQDDQSRIARLLKVQSDQGRSELKERIFRIAGAYDAGLIEAETRPKNGETRKSLKAIGKLARKLHKEINGANHNARWDVAWALSERRERKLSTGERVLPYGHPLSNQWMFEKEIFEAFNDDLIAVEIVLEKHIEKLGRGGRPRRPEHTVIRELEELWKERHGKAPRENALGPFIELCELALKPIASRRCKSPDIAGVIKNVLYGPEPTPGPYEV